MGSIDFKESNGRTRNRCGGCTVQLIINIAYSSRLSARTAAAMRSADNDLHGASFRSRAMEQAMTKRQAAEAIRKSGTSQQSVEPSTTMARLRAALAAVRPPRRQPIGALLTAAGVVDEMGIHRGLAAQEVRPTARSRQRAGGDGRNHWKTIYILRSADQLGVPYVRSLANLILTQPRLPVSPRTSRTRTACCH